MAILTALLITLNGASVAAPTAPDYSGWWAVRAGERNLMILHLEVGKNNLLTGELWRPSEYAINPAVAERISGPTVREAVTIRSFEHNGLTFTVSNPAKPKDTDRWLVRLVDPMHAELLLDDYPSLSMDLVRVDAGAKVAEDWQADRSYTLARNTRPAAGPNAEMTRLFNADQDARKANHIDWSTVTRQDAERRTATLRLLDAGSLHTADDYIHAAFVFQHGGSPDDYLLAHTLAMVAVNKGRQDAIWIAAATLDRYLQTIGQPQIYGTQYKGLGGKTTQDPYNRSLISDALRTELSVPSMAAQETQRVEFERQDSAH